MGGVMKFLDREEERVRRSVEHFNKEGNSLLERHGEIGENELESALAHLHSATKICINTVIVVAVFLALVGVFDPQSVLMWFLVLVAGPLLLASVKLPLPSMQYPLENVYRKTNQRMVFSHSLIVFGLFAGLAISLGL